MPSASVSRHGREVASVFDLMGTDENALTAALGFTLARSPELLSRVTERLLPGVVDTEDVVLRMETSDERGRTDLEIQAGDRLAVIEAKRGWQLPGERQLAAYAPRVRAVGDGVLATLSSASPQWASHSLPAEVEGVPVRHLPWTEIRTDLAAARTASRGEQRHWLDELHEYLRRAVRVRTPQDSWTYCVVVSGAKPGGGGARSFRDFVDQGWYFHPFGTGGWPKDPPNFLAFRWRSTVQRIHRVTEAEVIPSLLDRWPDIPATEDTERPFAVYRLGPALPGPPIPSGATYRASRMWVLLDQLLTSPTLADALKGTDALTSG
jgi:hypothetical protein